MYNLTFKFWNSKFKFWKFIKIWTSVNNIFWINNWKYTISYKNEQFDKHVNIWLYKHFQSLYEFQFKMLSHVPSAQNKRMFVKVFENVPTFVALRLKCCLHLYINITSCRCWVLFDVLQCKRDSNTSLIFHATTDSTVGLTECWAL